MAQLTGHISRRSLLGGSIAGVFAMPASRRRSEPRSANPRTRQRQDAVDVPVADLDRVITDRLNVSRISSQFGLFFSRVSHCCDT